VVAHDAGELGRGLGPRNLGWGLGVVSSNGSDSADDAAGPREVRDLFGPAGGGIFNPSSCPALPFGGGGTNKNGFLCDRNGANFTTDPQKFKDCVSQAAGQSITTEHTVTIATAALARALPRSANDPKKLRDDAATVVISVTDEFDDHIQSEMGWRDAGGAGDPPNDPTRDAGFDSTGLDQAIQPFVDYFLRPSVAAPIFGIIWVPGQACSTASEAAAGIERVAARTGGSVGDLCSGGLQSTLEQIAQASAGLASGLRLRGIPVPSSVVTRVGRVLQQDIVVATRSRDDGWDYDQVTNVVTFLGASRPKTGDRVVIAYKRWQGSVSMCISSSDCPTVQKFRCIDGECR